jgi:hypothetical protein
LTHTVPSAPVVTLVLYPFGPAIENVAPACGAWSLDVFEITIAPRPACGSVNAAGAFGAPLSHVAP